MKKKKKKKNNSVKHIRELTYIWEKQSSKAQFTITYADKDPTEHNRENLYWGKKTK